MTPTIKVENCLQPPGKPPRFNASVGDSVLFRDDKNQLAEGIIRVIEEHCVGVSLPTSNKEVEISNSSIIALMLNN